MIIKLNQYKVRSIEEKMMKLILKPKLFFLVFNAAKIPIKTRLFSNTTEPVLSPFCKKPK